MLFHHGGGHTEVGGDTDGSAVLTNGKSCRFFGVMGNRERMHLQSAGRRYSGRIVELDPQAGIVVELGQGGRRLFDPHTTTVVRD